MNTDSTLDSRPRAYSYIRFSTSEQMEGDSLRRQTEKAEKYALKRGLVLDTELKFRDMGVSAYRGRNAYEGELAAFKDAVKEGIVPQGSYLLVENLDRLSREDPQTAANILREIVNYGVYVVTLSDEQVYDKAALKDIWTFIKVVLGFARAHEESLVKAGRLRDSWHGKRIKAADSGKVMTKWCPAWLSVKEDRTGFDVVEEKAEVVRGMYRDYLNGVSIYNISLELNKTGVVPFTAGTGKRGAREWQKSYVDKILSNPAVVGVFQPHRSEYVDGKRVRVPLEPMEGYYPAVVEREVYDAVQTMRNNSSAPARGRHARKPVPNIFASLMKCPRCGAIMQLTRKDKQSPYYLVCGKARNGTGCSYQSLRYERVEMAFVEQIGAVVGECPSSSEAEGKLWDQYRNNEDAMGEVRTRLENLIRVLERDGGIAPVEILDKIRGYEEDLRMVQKEQEGLLEQIRTVTSDALSARLGKLADVVSDIDIDRSKVNAELRRLLSDIVPEFDDNQLRLVWIHGGESYIQYESGLKRLV